MHPPLDKGGGTSEENLHSDLTSGYLAENEEGMDISVNEVGCSRERANSRTDAIVAGTQLHTKTVEISNLKTPEPSKFFNINKPSLYADSVYVFMERLGEENLGRLHPMYVGHILHRKLNIPNILNIERVGKNRIKVQLKNIIDANKLISNQSLISEKLRAFIPNNLLARKGIVRGVDTRFDDNYLINNIVSSSTVIEVKRFQRKIQIDGEQAVVPRQTVLLTFEGNKIPNYIHINSVRCPVETYIQRVVQCYNCLRFGHVAKQCRSTVSRCVNCSQEKKDQHSCRDPEDSFCLFCNNNEHKTISKLCPNYEKQTKIKAHMANTNSSYTEAKKIVDSSYANTLGLNNRYDVLNTIDDSNFPPLQNNNKKTKRSNLSFTQSFSQPSGLHNTPHRYTTLTQPLHSKKRKAHSPIVTTPTIQPMFSFNPGPLNPLPPNPYRPKYSGINKNKIIESFSDLLQNLVRDINSLEELKNLSRECLSNKISSILEFNDNFSINIQSGC